MTSHTDPIVIDTFRFLAETSAQIDAFRGQLRQVTDLAVVSYVECRYYGTELYVCVCLEADVDPNRTLTWWLDIRPRPEGWLVEASVLWNGRDMVAQVPSQTLPDFHTVKQEVPRMLKHLLDAGGLVLAKARPARANQPDTLKTNVLDEENAA